MDILSTHHSKIGINKWLVDRGPTAIDKQNSSSSRVTQQLHYLQKFIACLFRQRSRQKVWGWRVYRLFASKPVINHIEYLMELGM